MCVYQNSGLICLLQIYSICQGWLLSCNDKPIQTEVLIKYFHKPRIHKIYFALYILFLSTGCSVMSSVQLASWGSDYANWAIEHEARQLPFFHIGDIWMFLTPWFSCCCHHRRLWVDAEWDQGALQSWSAPPLSAVWQGDSHWDWDGIQAHSPETWPHGISKHCNNSITLPGAL